MLKKNRILIVGIGGVGGYFGGMLANTYSANDDIEIIFKARGEQLNKIQADGLKVIDGDSEFICTPTIAVDNVSDIGIVDFVIICIKTYALESTLKELKSCLGDDTVLIPLLNGVDAAERISKVYPQAAVWKGCVYIISRLKQIGVIENLGNIRTLFFGVNVELNEKHRKFQNILENAGIESTLTQSIDKVIWEKFIFISSMATATSYFDASIGEVISNHYESLLNLINEVKEVASSKNISMDVNIETSILSKLKSLPYNATSSMHSDFRDLKPQNELDSLTGYVVFEAEKLGLETPTYKLAYNKLSH